MCKHKFVVCSKYVILLRLCSLGMLSDVMVKRRLLCILKRLYQQENPGGAKTLLSQALYTTDSDITVYCTHGHARLYTQQTFHEFSILNFVIDLIIL